MIEQIEYRGFNINIEADNPINSPRDWDNLGTIVCWHSRYNIGDKHDYISPSDFVYDLMIECNLETDKLNDDFDTELTSEEFIEKYLDKLYNKCIILPIYLYDHSGITINTCGFSCPWDSGQIGWIYVTHEKVKQEFGWKIVSKKRREKIEKYLTGEVETYNQFLTGDVYGYTIEPKDTNKEIKCNGSCWGFYGCDYEKSGLLEYAKSDINYAIRQYKEQVIKNKKERVDINNFMKTCWAH